ncbi:MAG: hemolysin III family protein [Opitutales bacterium]|nr:hemolysin III family protein [Opitutales bacterium]
MGYSAREEFLNTASHLLAAAVFCAAGAWLATRANALGLGAFKTMSVVVFYASAVFAFLASALYHGARGAAKYKLKLLDHIAIFFMSFGVFFVAAALSELPKSITIALSALLFLAAVAGSWLKIKMGADGTKKWSLIFNVAMPSFIIIPMFYMPAKAVMFFALAAALDLIGLAFYLKKDAEFTHAIWHIFSTLTVAGDTLAVYCML